MHKNLSRYWLLLGTSALAVAGLYSLVLVIARTPALASLPLFKRLFHEALVVHVDLSVLVWFLAIACLLWSRAAKDRPPFMPYLEESSLISMGLGTLLIAASPLDPQAEALMSNYIPVISSPIFFLGVSLILCSVGLMLVRIIGAKLDRIHQYGAAIACMSIVCFIWSYRILPPIFDGQQYYDMLFWGGGHVLQLLHVHVMMIAWVLVATAITTIRISRLLFTFGFGAALASPIIYLAYDITSGEFRQSFTNLMIFANGVMPGILAVILLPKLWRARQKNALWNTLFISILMFLYGGVLGGLIHGQNVVIPAHYHGSIVGITLAFMALAYLLLPEFSYRDPKDWRLARWQPYMYGIGQVMHITGLAYSGGYGVLRKTPGEVANISLDVKAALGFMGLGGLLAIIGGLMFVIVVGKAVIRADSAAAQ